MSDNDKTKDKSIFNYAVGISLVSSILSLTQGKLSSDTTAVLGKLQSQEPEAVEKLNDMLNEADTSQEIARTVAEISAGVALGYRWKEREENKKKGAGKSADKSP